VSWVQLLLRWLHILPAVIAGGATIYSAVALVPTFGALSDEARAILRERVASRWRPVVSICIALLLGSGLTNFLMFQSKLHHGQPLYQGLFGVKFLAAMTVFFISSALVGRSAALQPMRDRMGFWIRVNAALVVLIVVISGILKNIPAAP
jgi:phosphatidylglycerophosphate synthase